MGTQTSDRSFQVPGVEGPERDDDSNLAPLNTAVLNQSAPEFDDD